MIIQQCRYPVLVRNQICTDTLNWFFAVTNFIVCWPDRSSSLIDGWVIVPVDEIEKRHWCRVDGRVISEAEYCQIDRID
jgi:hypothetical protein